MLLIMYLASQATVTLAEPKSSLTCRGIAISPKIPTLLFAYARHRLSLSFSLLG